MMACYCCPLCNKTLEEGDSSCHCFLRSKTLEEGDNSRFCLLCNNTNKKRKGNDNKLDVMAFFVATTIEEKKSDNNKLATITHFFFKQKGKLLPFPFHNKKQKEKKKAMTRLCQGVLSPSSFQT